MLIYWSFQVLYWILQWNKLLNISVSTLKNSMAPSFEFCFCFSFKSFFGGTWSIFFYLSLELLLGKCQRPLTPIFAGTLQQGILCVLLIRMLKVKVILIIYIFLGSLSSSPIFWPHSLNLSSKKTVFFQKPDIGNSWPALWMQLELSVIWATPQPAEISLSKWRQK